MDHEAAVSAAESSRDQAQASLRAAEAAAETATLQHASIQQEAVRLAAELARERERGNAFEAELAGGAEAADALHRLRERADALERTLAQAQDEAVAARAHGLDLAQQLAGAQRDAEEAARERARLEAQLAQALARVAEAAQARELSETAITAQPRHETANRETEAEVAVAPTASQAAPEVQ
jgi:hypothetical protein